MLYDSDLDPTLPYARFYLRLDHPQAIHVEALVVRAAGTEVLDNPRYREITQEQFAWLYTRHRGHEVYYRHLPRSVVCGTCRVEAGLIAYGMEDQVQAAWQEILAEYKKTASQQVLTEYQNAYQKAGLGLSPALPAYTPKYPGLPTLQALHSELVTVEELVGADSLPPMPPAAPPPAPSSPATLPEREV